jgi:predicted nucleic acid-binding protein
MGYLLDTNACIALINRTSEPVRKRFSKAVESGEQLWVASVSLY